MISATPERVVRVRALAGDIVLCSWARHFTITVPLSTQVYKWASRPGEVETFLAASCCRHRDKLQQLWASLGSKASHFYLPNFP